MGQYSIIKTSLPKMSNKKLVLGLIVVVLLCRKFYSFSPFKRFLSNLFNDLACQSDMWDLVPEILNRIKEPQIPSKTTCNIFDFGAVRSNNEDSVEEPPETVDANTFAFRDAIRYCHDAGGGIVMVPSGTYLTSAITLLSNIALQITSGAVVRFTRDTTKYRNVFTRWEGIELMNYSPFIYAFNAENISITGNNVSVVSFVDKHENV